jgi:hypothetical protein
MARATYQTFTPETPLPIFREDFLRRQSMCAALGAKFPGLEAVGSECTEIIAAMDARKVELQRAEDALVRARALEDAEKIDVIDSYSRLRTILLLDEKETARVLLPDAPSSLGRAGLSSFKERIAASINNLRSLPEDHPVRVEHLPLLEAEHTEFLAADQREDQVKAELSRIKLSLTLYRAELAQLRDGQLGSVQSELEDRARTALFTIPWRKSSRSSSGEGDVDLDEPTPPTPPDAPPV